MNIALIDVDGHNFPNLALAKLSTYHKAKGDTVEWYLPLFSNPDVIYASKVFTYTADYINYAPNHLDKIVKGGIGYNVHSKLPTEVEQCLPDLTLYPQYDFAYGFLTRGCINKCSWCVVPKKESDLTVADTLERVSQGKKKVVLLDNNFLAAPREFVISQLEYAIKNKIKLDFNQNLDCRLVNDEYASLLANCKWIDYIRFACDTDSQLEQCIKAIQKVRSKGYKKDIFVCCMAKDFDSIYRRIKELLKIDNKIEPFIQPFSDFTKDKTPVEAKVKDLVRWCNRVWIRKKCTFEEYKKGDYE